MTQNDYATSGRLGAMADFDEMLARCTPAASS